MALTRADRWLRWIKDHRLFAVLFVGVVVGGAILGLLNHSLDIFDRLSRPSDGSEDDTERGTAIRVTFQDGTSGVIEVSVVYQLLAENALAMYQDVGPLEDAARLLEPMISGCVTAVLEARTYQYFTGHRTELEEQILQRLRGKAAGIHLTIHEVLLGSFFRNG